MTMELNINGSPRSAGRPLLTIAIPTYNRVRYLDICLAQILKQYPGHEQELEIIVSDNHSSEDTGKVVDSYIARKMPIQYVRQDTNLGADRNFADCFRRAKGKYVLIFGDDDIFLDGSLTAILDVLSSGEYGNVYISSYGFKEDHLKERPGSVSRRTGVVVFDNTDEYLRKIGYWITFSSGNIVNKSLIESEIDTTRFLDTNMVQLNWILSAILKAKRSIFMEEQLVAFKVGNTGGYRLCQVFGVNINRVFATFIQDGVPKRYFDIINRQLVNEFFPVMLLALRINKQGYKFDKERPFPVLLPVFRRYPGFWLFVVPVIFFPLPLATFYHRIVLLLRRILNR